jgi:hypothetical protein
VSLPNALHHVGIRHSDSQEAERDDRDAENGPGAESMCHRVILGKSALARGDLSMAIGHRLPGAAKIGICEYPTTDRWGTLPPGRANSRGWSDRLAGSYRFSGR